MKFYGYGADALVPSQYLGEAREDTEWLGVEMYDGRKSQSHRVLLGLASNLRRSAVFGVPPFLFWVQFQVTSKAYSRYLRFVL